MKDDRIYLLYVRDAIQYILEYTATGKEGFFADRKTQDAVVRNLEIIGEATKRVSGLLKDAHPDISWKPIAGMGEQKGDRLLFWGCFVVDRVSARWARYRTPMRSGPATLVSQSHVRSGTHWLSSAR
jgi:hypothetical protein